MIKKTERTCIVCGISTLGEKRNIRFCSNRCQQKHEYGKRVERWKDGTCLPGVASSMGGNHFVRVHLMEIQHNTCSICSQANTWNQQKLVFILDHINGNPLDNSYGNLRMVCPNCDTQLPTFKAKNKGHGRHTRRLRYQEGKSY